MFRSGARLTSLALALVALVLSHDLVFLVAHGAAGYDAAMEAGGHDGYWWPFVAIVGGLAIGLAAVAIRQVRRLKALADEVDAGLIEAPSDGLGILARSTSSVWVRLTASTAVLFVVQENLEHLSAGPPMPGIAALGGDEYGPALPIIALVVLALAGVVALVRWRRDILIRRIRVAARPGRRAPRIIRRPVEPLPMPAGSLLSRGLAGRAPPFASRP